MYRQSLPILMNTDINLVLSYEVEVVRNNKEVRVERVILTLPEDEVKIRVKTVHPDNIPQEVFLVSYDGVGNREDYELPGLFTQYLVKMMFSEDNRLIYHDSQLWSTVSSILRRTHYYW